MRASNSRLSPCQVVTLSNTDRIVGVESAWRDMNRTASPFGPALIRDSDRALGLGCVLQALLEALDLARGVDDCLLAGEERVAVGAYVDAELGSGRTDRTLGAARPAMDLGFVILG